MLKAGYTSVCEFHYLHHASDGTHYSDRAELSRRVIEAARFAGIGMTFLPVLYRFSGFGRKPAEPGQHRFLTSVDDIADLMERLSADALDASWQIGAAPHSLRAVGHDDLERLVAILRDKWPRAPIHLHISEQLREVEDCVEYYRARPVEWLFNSLPVDSRWCLIHATHLDDRELRRLAASGAVVGLCPTTEANLGDGFFPAAEFLSKGGRLGIGSDSHISICAAEELRLLEYQQRLLSRARNRLAGFPFPEVAESLYLNAVRGGAQASGRAIAGLQVGERADFIVLDENHADIAPLPGSRRLAGWIFSNHGASPVRDVYVGGRQVISEGRHPAEESVALNYRQTLSRLIRA
jgi:formimidoylglutamate deiminase